MRIRVLSDLHLEFASLEPTPVDCDAVVLAGDIHTGAQGFTWAHNAFGDRPIVYVPGNHEYYGYDWELIPAQLEVAARTHAVRLLDRGECVIDDVRFVGCTLWTDFGLFGEARRAQAMAAAEASLFDYRHIRAGTRALRAEDTRLRHQTERAWLEERLREAPQGRWRTTVVVTHMAPSWRSTAERFRDSITSAGFCSHLDELVERAPLWIHGHTHDSFDYRLGESRVVCNPRGYPHRSRSSENPQFDEQLIVTV
ncbi:MAG TPA: metallophosphoesterase [Burkholderiaceae bacterium]|nr:metallophosphoesterase [Burkholderiaceae bacterium]